MPVTSARAMGTSLTLKHSGSEQADTVMGSLLSIGGVSVEVEERDITTLDSPDGADEFEAGKTTAGELQISGLIKKTADEQNIAKFYALLWAKETREWVITYPSGATWDFNAFVKSFEMGEANVDGNVEFTSTLKLSGRPTYTASAA